MATSSEEARFPDSVTFNDDDPNEGYAKLFLTMKEIELEKSCVVGKPKPKNAEITVSFANSLLVVNAVVKRKDDSKILYSYKKDLLEDVKESDCKYKVRHVHGESQLLVKLAKVKKESWAAHARHFTQYPASA